MPKPTVFTKGITRKRSKVSAIKPCQYSVNDNTIFGTCGIQGRVGITLNVNWDEPENSDAANQEAADRNMQFSVGWFANPIFGDGNYPRVMIDQVGHNEMLTPLTAKPTMRAPF